MPTVGSWGGGLFLTSKDAAVRAPVERLRIAECPVHVEEHPRKPRREHGTWRVGVDVVCATGAACEHVQHTLAPVC